MLFTDILTTKILFFLEQVYVALFINKFLEIKVNNCFVFLHHRYYLMWTYIIILPLGLHSNIRDQKDGETLQTWYSQEKAPGKHLFNTLSFLIDQIRVGPDILQPDTGYPAIFLIQITGQVYFGRKQKKITKYLIIKQLGSVCNVLLLYQEFK